MAEHGSAEKSLGLLCPFESVPAPQSGRAAGLLRACQRQLQVLDVKCGRLRHRDVQFSSNSTRLHRHQRRALVDRRWGHLLPVPLTAHCLRRGWRYRLARRSCSSLQRPSCTLRRAVHRYMRGAHHPIARRLLHPRVLAETPARPLSKLDDLRLRFRFASFGTVHGSADGAAGLASHFFLSLTAW